jgi:hypothetical protein
MRRLLAVLAFAVLALVLLASVLLASSAAAQPSVSRLYLGIAGDPARFQGQTGQASAIKSAYIGWDQGRTYATRLPVLLRQLQPVPMLHIGTGGPLGRNEAITPLQIAQGKGDAFLVALNEAIAGYGGLVYLRLLSEMNHFSHFHSAFNANGTSRGPAYRPEVYRKMFARMYVLLHGGPAAQIDVVLKRLGLPLYAGADLAAIPTRLRIIWNPLGGGQPETEANRFYRFYPGNRYLEIVGNDIYGAFGQYAGPQNEVLYAFARAHHKPFALPEFGVRGSDYPTFVQYVCKFLRTHGGIELAAYYKSQSGGLYDLGNKPASRQAYRDCLTPLGRKAP